MTAPHAQNPAPERIRVVIVDDEPLMRTGLRLILGGAPDIEVAGEAGNGEEALAGMPGWAPGVVLMDIRMPVLDGIGATRAIVEGASDPARAPRVLVLTAFDTDGFILEALRAGAVGFLLKDTPPAELVGAVRSAAAGTNAMSPSVVRRLVDLAGASAPAAEPPADPLAGLSAREREIAECVAAGMTNGEIAAQLFVSLPTVKTHVARVFDKLGVTNRVQLAILVLEAR
ncbi:MULTISPECIES: response regulator transcription factor [unclassified Brevibacterium]|uniref:response regulator n=1 Tax=unclassified Brevibacterium TaxID=2614124 RepID=UPI0010C78AF7|nr:response regulator transcription factor [Brevibacterium sp. CS2]QCP04288.1 response regulator transcription factor [Brevibacterium sp. CS2]